VTVTHEAVAVPAPRRRARTRPRGRSRPRVAGGAAWIVVGAVLLAGIVALNVAVLRLNLQLDDLGRQRMKLRAENAELASEISSAAANAKIQALAKRELGLVQADPAETTYVELAR
jgi:cell division protein FtsL